MAFDTLPARLRPVAESGLRLIVNRFGRTGLKTDSEIHPSISWKPTLYVKSRSLIVAAEVVDEVIYPPILKIAAHDINHYDRPVSVYVICQLETFQADKQQTTIRLLKKHGFGIITVDAEGVADFQHQCIPLNQHIPEDEFESQIRGLTPNLKVLFRNAYTTYETREGQGLQEAGQIVEAVVSAMAEEAFKKRLVTRGELGNSAADNIDALYKNLPHRRGALGGAREFMREYRNIASHPTKSAAEAMEKIRRCKDGFFRSIRITEALHEAMRQEKMPLRLHIG
jgi:hypothetical protein